MTNPRTRGATAPAIATAGVAALAVLLLAGCHGYHGRYDHHGYYDRGYQGYRGYQQEQAPRYLHPIRLTKPHVIETDFEVVEKLTNKARVLALLGDPDVQGLSPKDNFEIWGYTSRIDSGRALAFKFQEDRVFSMGSERRRGDENARTGHSRLEVEEMDGQDGRITQMMRELYGPWTRPWHLDVN